MDLQVSDSHRETTQNGVVDILVELWRIKWIAFGLMSASAVISVYFALQMPNIYRTTVLLAPATEKKAGIGGLGSQLGGLASLAGVNLSASGGIDKTDLAIELLKSKRFLSEFIAEHGLLIPLMAAKNWDMQTNTFVLDDDVFDSNKNVWVRPIIPPRKSKPSLEEAAGQLSGLIEISKDKMTGMVKMSLDHMSPELVQRWAHLLVIAVNKDIRDRDILEAQSSLDYLSQQLQITEVAEIRSSLAQLIEEQTKTLMMANIRDEYVLKVVDPAFLPEEKIKPRRSLVVLMSMFSMGLFLMMVGYIRLLSAGRPN